jgi:3-deoxy-D-manno-octulosonate 8-phosphate phosphatase (KDO 8-P phosphatase)
MNIDNLFRQIQVFVFDIDGVLTDGSLLATEDGHLLRRMNIKDGYALQLAIKKGYRIWVISGSTSEAVRARLNKLGITDVHTGIESKSEMLEEIIAASKTDHAHILYMGDDIPDYACMNIAALPCCPANAVEEIKEVSKYISPHNGGEGCVSDVIEKVLKLNGHWDLHQ